MSAGHFRENRGSFRGIIPAFSPSLSHFREPFTEDSGDFRKAFREIQFL
jgi:hypothetical protein